MKISKSKSCSYWTHLKSKINRDFGNEELWEEAFQLFKERIEYRYLNPIELIEKNESFSGEGFTIMTLYCSLIEFLETTLQGVNFRFSKKKDLNPHEYTLGKSKELFVSFLTKRNPFKIDKNTAELFYTDVRCGLLHEAQTKSNWKIRVDNDKVISKTETEFIINRKIFGKKINQYIELYGKKMKEDKLVQEAFIRKFDYLCK